MDAFAPGTALCAPFLEALPITGLSICVVSGAGAQSTVATSDRVAARLEQLQFELGEGPAIDVVLLGLPVLTRELGAASAEDDWPMFAPAAFEAGARALFSFPLLLGTGAAGVVSMYDLAVRPPWPAALLVVAARLAAAAVQPAVELATRAAAEDFPRTGWQRSEMRREVHQAGGMLMVQLGCGIDEAMARLRAFAFSAGRPIDAVARDVVRGVLLLTEAE